MNDSTLPGCIGDHNHPIVPDGPCNTCSHEELCKTVIAKKKLQPILDKILEIEILLKR